MFDRLIVSGGTHPRPPLAPLAVSVIANLAVAYVAAVTTRSPEAAPVAEAPASEHVVYLIPPPPQRVPFEEMGLLWAGGVGPGIIAAPLDEASLMAVPAGGDDGVGAGRRGGKKDRPGNDADSLPLAGELAGGTVYVAAELDQPVSFDPTSAAPAYPADLQSAGIEGSATMRFVVDTTGSADSTTIEQIAATHQGFVVAVREALPRMHFRPAELGQQRVRQLVEQQFKFQLSPVAALPAAAVGDSAVGDSAAVDSGAAFAGAAALPPGDSLP